MGSVGILKDEMGRLNFHVEYGTETIETEFLLIREA